MKTSFALLFSLLVLTIINCSGQSGNAPSAEICFNATPNGNIYNCDSGSVFIANIKIHNLPKGYSIRFTHPAFTLLKNSGSYSYNNSTYNLTPGGSPLAAPADDESSDPWLYTFTNTGATDILDNNNCTITLELTFTDCSLTSSNADKSPKPVFFSAEFYMGNNFIDYLDICPTNQINNNAVYFNALKPHIKLVPFTAGNCPVNIGSTTASSQNNSTQLKFSTITRYYLLQATSGIVDFFTFDIAPENELLITSIEAVNPNTLQNALPSALYSLSGTSNPASIHLVFDNKLIKEYYNGAKNYLEAAIADSSYILIKETAQVVNCTDNKADPTSDYILKIYCDGRDHSMQTPDPFCIKDENTLDIVCDDDFSTPALESVHLSNQINMCSTVADSNSTIITLTYRNFNTTLAGELELSTIQIPFNGLYFSLDNAYGIKLDGIPVNYRVDNANKTNNGGVTDKFIVLNPTDFSNSGGYTNPDDGTQLQKSYTDANGNILYSDPNFPNSYVFIAPGSSFQVSFRVTFSCNATMPDGIGGTYSLKNANQDFSFSDFNIQSNSFYVMARDMCSMGWHKQNGSIVYDSNPGNSNISSQWISRNQYAGPVDGNVTPKDVGAGLSIAGHVSFTFYPNVNFDALRLDLSPSYNSKSFNSGPANTPVNNLFDCKPVYYVIVKMDTPQYSLDLGNATGQYKVTIIDNTKNTQFDVLPGQVDYKGNGVYYITYSNVAGFEPGDVITVAFNAVLDMKRCFGPGGVTFGTNDFNVEFRVACNSDCIGSGCYRFLGNGTVSLARHCIETCTSYPKTSNFSMERNTFGWKNYADYSSGKSPVLYDSVKAGISNGSIDASVYPLNKVYESDHVHCESTRGHLIPFGNNNYKLCFDIYYDLPPDFNRQNIFKFLDGKVHFRNLTDSFDIILDATDVSYTTPNPYPAPENNFLLVRINIPENSAHPFYTDKALQTVPYDLSFSADFKINVPNNSTLYSSNYTLDKIKGQFRLYDPANLLKNADNNGIMLSSCDPFGAGLEYLNLNVSFHPYLLAPYTPYIFLGNDKVVFPPQYNNDCMIRFLAFSNVTGGLSVDEFPNEFRPYIRWPSLMNFQYTDPAFPNQYKFVNAQYLNPTDLNTWYNFDSSRFVINQSSNGVSIKDINNNPLLPVFDKTNSNIQAFMLTYQRTCMNGPQTTPSVNFLINNFSATLKEYADSTSKIKMLFGIKDGNSYAGGAMSYNNIINTAPGSDIQLVVPTDTIKATTSTVYIPCGINENSNGQLLPNDWIYFTSSNPAMASDSDITIDSVTYTNCGYLPLSMPIPNPVNGLYKIPSLPHFNAGANCGRIYFTVKVNLHCKTVLNPDSVNFYITAHYGYTCVNADYSNLQLVVSNGSYQRKNGWNSCSDNSKNVYIRTQTPNLNVTALGVGYHLATSSQSSCSNSANCQLVYLDVTVNNLTSIQASDLNFYAIPAGTFKFCPDASSAEYDVLGANAKHYNFNPGEPTISEVPSSVNSASQPYALAWNVNDLLKAASSYPYLFKKPSPDVASVVQSITFHLAFKPDCAQQGNTYGFNFIGVCKNVCDNYVTTGDFYRINVPYSSSSFAGCCDSTPFVINITSPKPGCSLGCSGSFTVSVAPVMANYFMNISYPGGVISGRITDGTNYTIKNLCAGDYTILVYGNDGFVASKDEQIKPSANSSPAVNLNITNADCDSSSGEINTLVTGGLSPYSYLWSNNDSSKNIIDIKAGDYSVTVTDANQCSVEATALVISKSAAPELIPEVNDASCGNKNGRISVTIQKGTPPFYFKWSNGATTQNIAGLGAGYYSVTVTTATGCTGTLDTVINNHPSISVTALSTDDVCGTNSGKIFIEVNYGEAPYQFNWANGNKTDSAFNLPAGNYIITVTDASGCSGTVNAAIKKHPSLSVQASAANITCNLINGALYTKETGGTPPFTYSWSNGYNTDSVNNINTEGTYTVTITDVNNCSATSVTTIKNEPAPSLHLLPVNANCGLSNGSVNLNIFGGTAPFKYHWSTGATTNNINQLGQGNYNVGVVDANGCGATSSTHVTQEPQLNVQAAPQVTQCGGIIGLTINGVGPFKYKWSTGDTTSIIGNLKNGTYTVTVTDKFGCSISTSAEISNSNIMVPTINSTGTTCGRKNGALDLTISGGTPPFAINWSNNDTVTGLLNLDAGTYYLTLTDANGCSIFESGAVKASMVFHTTISGDSVICTGTTDLLTAGAGATYKWSDGSAANHITINNGGNYSVTVTDTIGCVDSSRFTVVANPLPVLSVSPSVICKGVNTQLNATGANSYSWSPSTGLSATDIANPVASTDTTTTYTLTGLLNGCSDSSNVIITVNPLPEISVFPTTVCSGVNTILTATGAATYSWLPSTGLNKPDTAEPVANLTSTTTYTISGSLNNCSDSSVVVISVISDTINISLGNDQQLCNGEQTVLNASILPRAGYTGNYNYVWLKNDSIIPGIDTSAYTASTSGRYKVEVTDNCGTTANASVLINIAKVPMVNSVIVNSTCGYPDGTISLTPGDSNSVYSYKWDDNSSLHQRSDLVAGAYLVTISDVNGCSSTDSIVVENVNGPSIIENHNNTACGNNNGSITLIVSGGTTPYAYQWSDGETTQNLTNLPAGTYSITVTDASTCKSTTDITLINISGPIATVLSTNATCTKNNGSASLNIGTGTPPFLYSWSTGDTTSIIKNLPAGNYNVTITDSNSCSFNTGFVIDSIPAPALSFAIVGTSCGYSNGNISITPDKGTPPYSFLWSNATTTQNLSGLAAGNYSIAMTDSNNCEVDTSFTVSTSSGIRLSITTNNSICGRSTGSLNLNSAGGTPPYSYNWNNGGTTQNLNAIAKGSYAVTVTDAGQCTAGISTNLLCTPPLPCQLLLSSSVTNASCFGVCDAVINLSVSNAMQPIQILWNTGDTIPILTNLCSGTYFVKVKDSNLCLDSLEVNVNQPKQLLANSSVINVLCNGDSTGAINIDVTGGTPSYDYKWSNNSFINGQSKSNLAANNYSITITDSHNCIDTLSQPIKEPAAFVLMSSHKDENCNQLNGTASIDIEGGVFPYKFRWSNEDTAQAIHNLKAGTYMATITDANNCIIVSPVIVNEIPGDLISLSKTSDTICSGQEITVSASGSGNYVWAPTEGLNSSTGSVIHIFSTQSSDYTITSVDSNGCKDEAHYYLIVHPTAIAGFSPDSASGCAPLQIAFQNNSSNADKYLWLFGNNTSSTEVNPIVMFDSSGNYGTTLIAYSPYGCNDSIKSENIIKAFPVPRASFTTKPEPGTVMTSKNSTVTFINESVDAENYCWDFGDKNSDSIPNPVHRYRSDSVFNVRLIVTNEYGCRDTTTGQEIVVPDGEVYIPNILTPNGDGNNDYFRVYGEGIKWCHMKIFDRWGSLVYEASSTSPSWDGTSSGKPMNTNVFVYALEVNFSNGVVIYKSGDITLIR